MFTSASAKKFLLSAQSCSLREVTCFSAARGTRVIGDRVVTAIMTRDINTVLEYDHDPEDQASLKNRSRDLYSVPKRKFRSKTEKKILFFEHTAESP